MIKNYEQKIGIYYAVAAFLFWGMVPVYFKQVAHVDPFEVLIHRIMWSVAVLIILLYISKQFRLILPIFRNKVFPNYLHLF